MRSFVCILLILGLYSGSIAQIDPVREQINKNLTVGEDLTYVVKYAFLRLGEVRIRVAEKLNLRDKPVYKTIANIDSYPDLPFVIIHQVYESYIDSAFFPLKFFAKIFGDDTIFVNYDFYKSGEIKMEKGNLSNRKLWLDSTAYIDERFQDGLSILFYTRMNTGMDKTMNIPCFVNEKEEITTINFYSQNESVLIDSVDYEIDCVKIEGKTDFVSVYGLTGHFKGWFSNDVRAIPIIAKMNVIIGNVTLELIKWNKAKWNPPAYKN